MRPPDMGSMMLQLAGLAAAALVLLVVAVALARRPVTLVYLLLAAYFADLSFVLPSAAISGITVSPVDTVNALAFAAAVIRLRRPRGLQWALIGFAALVLYATANGFLSFRGEALLGFRAELYVAVPALLASTLTTADVYRVLRSTARFGIALALVAVVRWALVAVGINALEPANLAVYSTGYAIPRVIGSPSALWIAFAAVLGAAELLGVGDTRPTSRWLPLTTLFLLGVVLFAQFRSVWVATAVMFAVLLLGTRGRTRTKALLVTALLVVAVSIEAFELGDGGTVADSFYHAFTNVGTWTWRLERWQAVWDTHSARGVGAIIFGSGYGYSWVSGSVGTWEVSPHNGYIQIAVRVGLVGAALYFSAYAALLRRLRENVAPTAPILRVLSVGSLVYFIPYYSTPLTGVLLGCGVALLVAADANAVAPDERSVQSSRTAPSPLP